MDGGRGVEWCDVVRCKSGHCPARRSRFAFKAIVRAVNYKTITNKHTSQDTVMLVSPRRNVAWISTDSWVDWMLSRLIDV